VTRVCDAVWPDGDTARLRRAATAWLAAARTLDAGEPLVRDAVATVREQQSPEIDDAVTVCRSVGGFMVDLAEQCRVLATACTELAEGIDKAHDRLVGLAKDLARDTLIIQGVGLVFAWATLGGSEVAAQAAQAGEVATLVGRITRTIRELGEVARLAAARVSLTALDSTTAGLTSIATRVPILADTTALSRTRTTIDTLATRLHT
jgi:hypothetical protein